jgi:hypothetical protein
MTIARLDCQLDMPFKRVREEKSTKKGKMVKGSNLVAWR